MSELERPADMKKIVIAVIIVAVIAVGAYTGLLLLGGTQPTGNVLTIITRHDTSIHSVFEPAFLATDFAREHNIVDIKWKTPTGEYWEQLIDAGGIDVCWGGGPTLFDHLMQDGYLRPLNSTLLEDALSRVNDTIAGADMKRRNVEGDVVWVAAAISSFGFTVNHAFLEDHDLPTPATWTDLANATYGKDLPTIHPIAMGNAPGTTSNTRIYEIITQALGWEQGWITLVRMGGSANIYSGSVEVQTAVETAEVGIAMSIDFYGFVTQSKNPDCEYIIPEGQSIVNGDPIAIAYNTQQFELAEGFVNWILTPEAQALWLNSNIMRMPVMREAFDTPAGRQNPALYESFNRTVKSSGIDFNDTLSLLTNFAFIQYFESVITDAHSELVSCWDLLVDAYYSGKLNETAFEYYATLMGTPVTIIDPISGQPEKFTVDYAMYVNSRMLEDQVYSGQLQVRWTDAAKAVYAQIYAEISELMI